jgi:hypothetical protein
MGEQDAYNEERAMRQCKPGSYGTMGSKDEKSESHSSLV